MSPLVRGVQFWVPVFVHGLWQPDQQPQQRQGPAVGHGRGVVGAEAVDGCQVQQEQAQQQVIMEDNGNGATDG